MARRSRAHSWLRLEWDGLRSQFRGLSVAQKGAVATLMLSSFDETPPCTVPDDDSWLANECGVPLEIYGRELKPGVCRVWKSGSDGRLHWQWLRTAFDESRAAVNRFAEAGRKSAEARSTQQRCNDVQTTLNQCSIVDVDVGVSVPVNGEDGCGKKGSAPIPRPPDPMDINAFVSPEMLDLAAEWFGRPLTTTPLLELADRVQRFGEPLVSRCMKINLKSGAQKCNWPYLDKIIAGGGQERKSGTIAGVDMDAVLGTKK